MAENPQVEQFAADTILQRGVKVKIPAPFFLRVFRKKTINLTVTSPFEGTLHRVASYYLSTGITAEQLEGLTVEKALVLNKSHSKAISKAVAVAILNGYVSGWLFTKILAKYLRWHLKPVEMYTLVSLLIIHGGIQDFMNTTKSVRMMMITTPKKGQKTKGS